MKAWVVLAVLAAGIAFFTLINMQDGQPGPTCKACATVIAPSAYERLRTGDLVFRRGPDLISDAVLAARQGGLYSHVGMILIQDGRPHVVHAVPAETDYEQDRVVLERLEKFASPERALAVSIYRVRGLESDLIPELEKVAKDVIGKPFDSQFDLSTEDRLYCTELVWWVYRRMGVNLVQRFDELTLPFFARDVILPDSLIGPGLIKVY